MSLYEKYSNIVQSARNRLRNEQQTKDWVIRPVLEEVLGYHKLEIVPEVSGPGNARPDYTVLPDTPHTWLLEAKDWSEALSDQHALQATTYAYQHGTRWVVLSNGQEWRLYDSFVTGGGVNERLVLTATPDDPEALEALFQALHRAIVVADELETELNRYLLVVYLRQELQRADSECVTALRNVTRKKPHFEKTTGADIVDALAKVFARGETQPVCPGDTSSAEEQAEPVAVPTLEVDGVPLDKAGNPTHKKPVAIILPDGTRVETNTWKQVWLALFRYAAAKGAGPVPTPWTTPGAKSYFVHDQPMRSDTQPMFEPVTVSVDNRKYYLETHLGARWTVHVAEELCKEVGIDPSTIRLVYR